MRICYDELFCKASLKTPRGDLDRGSDICLMLLDLGDFLDELRMDGKPMIRAMG